MPHRFLVKDIAFQAGLSTATVDRVLNGRMGVRGQTAVRVDAAVRELERQESNLARSGKTSVIDVVIEAPERFSSEVRTAFEREAGTFYPEMFRIRFQSAEVIAEDDFIKFLDRIRLRGSAGVVVKARDTVGIVNAVRKLVAAGIPVVTLVTDLPGSNRLAYTGMNNKAAGATAAFLIAQTIGNAGGRVLATLSSSNFHGEEQRVDGFRATMAKIAPHVLVTDISEGFGRDVATGELVGKALVREPDICAVYSAGGGNRSILQAFDHANRKCRVFVAHDLDADNRSLLAEERINYVLHHDLRLDVRTIYRHLMGRNHRTGTTDAALSQIVVVTPFNMTGGGEPT